MTTANLLAVPEGAAKGLDEVIRHHRDRDDFPIHFRVFYLLREKHYAPLQHQYDSAVELLNATIKDAPAHLIHELGELAGRFNNEGFLSPIVVEKLQSLDEASRLAHAWAAYYIFATFGSLEPYLQTGVPPESRLLGVYPELATLLTPRDQLLPVGGAIAPGHAWVTYRGHDIHPHPGLRRGFGSRVHYELLGLLWAQVEAGNHTSIAVDHFRLCPHGELAPFIELDAWFGVPFNLEHVDDPHKVGATVHGRPRSLSPEQPAGFMTEFRWSYADGLKSLEIEELPVPRGAAHADSPVICRFIHSIRDVNNRRFIHLDGALTVYDNTKYGNRHEQATNHHESKVWADRKIKVFRVDAPGGDDKANIDDNAWTELIVSFFRGNELVLEYLGGRSFAETYRSRYGEEYPYWDD